ncbi:MAG: transketolase [Candidatus Levybacteria bacterium RBG_16_35_11]|nr:MAG: transketolase [Candidatus Levybacteria bacterium RBG_16_35_11]
MLNSDLKLNENLFSANVEQKATREGFGEGLSELGERNQNVVVLSADLSESTKAEDFAKKYPNRYFECGVAEQNMVAIAAGLGVSGKIPFVCSYSVFSPGKAWETVRTTIIYNNSNVKIAGHHAGIMTGPDGATHQATEDIASVRAWPGIQIFSPCDAIEAKKATLKSAEIVGPVYLRLSREKIPTITTDQTPFEDIQLFWISKQPKTVIFATGHVLYQALLAARELEEEGINVLVANVAVIKPLNEQKIVEFAKQAGKVVTVEDHQIKGGMGSAIAEVLAKEYPTKMEFVGLKDTFAESGKWPELMLKYGLDSKTIKQAVKKLV